MCGYGLTDVTSEDPRINWDSPLVNYELYSEQHTEDYLAFAAERQKICLDAIFAKQIKKEGKELPRVYESFEMGSVDGGLESVLCLRPVMMPEWSRYDNTLDWLEETNEHDQKDRVRVLDSGIFPYDGHMDMRTGERIKGDVYWWRNTVWNLNDKEFEPFRNDEKLLDTLADVFGMTHKEALKNVAPLVPEEIRLLAEFGKLFTSDDVWKQLRPMIYTWWA